MNGKYALHQRVYRISNFKANVSGQFIYWNMVAFFKRHIMRNTSSSTAPSIRKPALESYKLKMPNSIEEQEKIVSTLIDVNGILERQKNHIKSLNNLKDLLLQNLFV